MKINEVGKQIKETKPAVETKETVEEKKQAPGPITQGSQLDQAKENYAKAMNDLSYWEKRAHPNSNKINELKNALAVAEATYKAIKEP